MAGDVSSRPWVPGCAHGAGEVRKGTMRRGGRAYPRDDGEPPRGF